MKTRACISGWDKLACPGSSFTPACGTCDHTIMPITMNHLSASHSSSHSAPTALNASQESKQLREENQQPASAAAAGV